MENNYDLTLYCCTLLNVSTGQIRSAREYSTIEKHMVGTYFAVGFNFLILLLSI
jgi:hypothetical protein